MKKPNSVCKHCRKPIEVCLGESPDSTGQCKGYVHVASRTHFCPGHVAEPAEPSATSGITQPVEMDERGDVVRAEPTADYHCPNCNAPDYKGTCKSCKYSAHHEHLPAAPQPVAGEGPGIKVTIYDPIAYLQELYADMGRRGECDICLKLQFCIEVLKEKRAEGTPKLEELERQLSICEQNGTKWAHFKVADIRALLSRPFITPACSPLVECKGRKTCGDNNPGDCDWPFCDCDPRVNKVMQAIWESGYSIVKVTPASTEETRIDVDTLSSWLAVKMPDSLNLNTSERTPVKTWLAERITEFLSTGEANGQQLKDIRAALDDALNYLRTEQYENVGVFIKQAMFYAAPTSVPQARGCSCEPGNHANATACHNLGAKACVGVPQAEPPKEEMEKNNG